MEMTEIKDLRQWKPKFPRDKAKQKRRISTATICLTFNVYHLDKRFKNSRRFQLSDTIRKTEHSSFTRMIYQPQINLKAGIKCTRRWQFGTKITKMKSWTTKWNWGLSSNFNTLQNSDDWSWTIKLIFLLLDLILIIQMFQ